ncbi:MAG: SDR family oxidoreductase [Burkholderiales bacterium]|nr:SDR family oxidoreductase [Burkholderiales bacterium]
MELGLKGRRALVTGGSRGIGYGVARVLAAEGCELVLASRNPESLAAARKVLEERCGARVATHAADLSKSANVIALARECGDVDILVNNAGAIPQGAIDLDEQVWREAWDLKVFGFIALTREVYGRMCARGSGVIVNVLGNAGERPTPNYVAGSMANAALMTMTRMMGAESVRHNVRVVAVSPGYTETDRQIVRWKARAKAEFGDENRWRELTAVFPFGRLATVDEVANSVAFLASDCSGYTSGAILTIDGGFSRRAGQIKEWL